MSVAVFNSRSWLSSFPFLAITRPRSYPSINSHQYSSNLDQTKTSSSTHIRANMPEGRQSPEPERQSGKQQQSPPGSGQGTDNADNKEQVNADQLQVSPAHTHLIVEDGEADWCRTCLRTPRVRLMMR